jgi:hypothetical protein
MRCLGHFKGDYFFADAVGQVRALNAKQVQDYKELVGLMGGDTSAAVIGWSRSSGTASPTARSEPPIRADGVVHVPRP